MKNNRVHLSRRSGGGSRDLFAVRRGGTSSTCVCSAEPRRPRRTSSSPGAQAIDLAAAARSRIMRLQDKRERWRRRRRFGQPAYRAGSSLLFTRTALMRGRSSAPITRVLMAPRRGCLRRAARRHCVARNTLKVCIRRRVDKCARSPGPQRGRAGPLIEIIMTAARWPPVRRKMRRAVTRAAAAETALCLLINRAGRRRARRPRDGLCALASGRH